MTSEEISKKKMLVFLNMEIDYNLDRMLDLEMDANLPEAEIQHAIRGFKIIHDYTVILKGLVENGFFD